MTTEVGFQVRDMDADADAPRRKPQQTARKGAPTENDGGRCETQCQSKDLDK